MTHAPCPVAPCFSFGPRGRRGCANPWSPINLNESCLCVVARACHRAHPQPWELLRGNLSGLL